jgi:hypothetical protein
MASYDGSGYIYDLNPYKWIDADIDALKQKKFINIKET